MKWIKRLINKIKQHFVKKKIMTPALVERSLPKRQKTVFKIAKEEIGTKEIKGKKHNPRVVEYHKTTTLNATDDETAWCSAFVNWCHVQAVRKGTNSAMAISWLDWGKKVEKPTPGDVVVFRRKNSSWRGHVGFYVKETKKSVLVLGGNQSNEVNYQWYPKNGRVYKLAGYRRAK